MEAGIPVERTVTEGYTVAIRRKRTAIYYFRFNGIPEEALPCIINGAINMESKEYKTEVQEVCAHAKDIQTKTIGNQGETWYVKYVSSVVTTSDYKKHLGNLRLLERKAEIPPLEGETEESKQHRLRFLGSVQGCYLQHKEKSVELLRKVEEGQRPSCKCSWVPMLVTWKEFLSIGEKLPGLRVCGLCFIFA